MRAALAAGMRCVAVPNALTRPLARPPVDLVLDSLAERPLAEILEELERSPARALSRRSAQSTPQTIPHAVQPMDWIPTGAVRALSNQLGQIRETGTLVAM